MSMENGNRSSDAVRDVYFYLQKPIIFLKKLSYSFFDVQVTVHRDKFLQ
jgi:hypothetical protein